MQYKTLFNAIRDTRHNVSVFKGGNFVEDFTVNYLSQSGEYGFSKADQYARAKVQHISTDHRGTICVTVYA